MTTSIAGITVGLVALPLAMAFAIASGVTPQAGLYTAVVAGFIISALGGSRCPDRRPHRRLRRHRQRHRRRYGWPASPSAPSWPASSSSSWASPAWARRQVHPPPRHRRLHQRHRRPHRQHPDQGLLRPPHSARPRRILRKNRLLLAEHAATTPPQPLCSPSLRSPSSVWPKAWARRIPATSSSSCSARSPPGILPPPGRNHRHPVRRHPRASRLRPPLPYLHLSQLSNLSRPPSPSPCSPPSNRSSPPSSPTA
jgi:hypothetical protein